MKPPIILNESGHPDRPGDVSVFETVADLERYLEPWFVDEPHRIFDREGQELQIAADANAVRLALKVPHVSDPEILQLCLVAFLKSIAEAKGWIALGLTRDFVEAASLDELVEQSRRFAKR